MKHLAAILALCLASCVGVSAGGPAVTGRLTMEAPPSTPPIDVRWNGTIFVGHTDAMIQVEAFDQRSGFPFYLVTLEAGKRRVINRKLDYDETFELTESIPSWCAELYREVEKVGNTVPHLGIVFDLEGPVVVEPTP